MLTPTDSMSEIAVEPGQCEFSTSAPLVTYRLQSCVALAVHAPRLKLGALLRFSLPDSAIDRGLAVNEPWLFADTGIRLMLERFAEAGAAKEDLVVRAIGAASVPGAGVLTAVVKRNEIAMRRVLWSEGLTLRGEDIGGTASRFVWFDGASGRLLVRTETSTPASSERAEIAQSSAGEPARLALIRSSQ